MRSYATGVKVVMQAHCSLASFLQADSIASTFSPAAHTAIRQSV